MRDIDAIYIHCADTYPDMDIGVDEIREWHLLRGWSDIGYHYVIRRSGDVEIGRPIEKAGAHVKGHNENSVGICLVGGKPRFNFTYSQVASLRTLVNRLMEKFPIGVVFGHYEKNQNKQCPMFDVKYLLEGIV